MGERQSYIDAGLSRKFITRARIEFWPESPLPDVGGITYVHSFWNDKRNLLKLDLCSNSKTIWPYAKLCAKLKLQFEEPKLPQIIDELLKNKHDRLFFKFGFELKFSKKIGPVYLYLNNLKPHAEI